MPAEKKLHDSESNGIDLQKILERGEKGKTYTVEEIKELMDAYIKGAEQVNSCSKAVRKGGLDFLHPNGYN